MRLLIRLSLCGFLALVVLPGATSAWAQTGTATLIGEVSDQQKE